MSKKVVFIIVLLLAVSIVNAQTKYFGKELEEKVGSYLDQMTLREKIEYIGGYNVLNIRPIPRLGLPNIRMSDGPIGVHATGKATQYPASIMLAATWNTDLAKDYGIGLGRDCRARGVHILLGPGMNICRAPLCGRNFEYTGEDPVLSSKIAVELIKGVQSQGALATAKHFVANNQEYRRHDLSSNVDERTLREIYFPAFKASVQEGNVGCVMSSYNPLNGDWCTANSWLSIDVLRNEWGFDGIYMSDWHAVHEIVDAANSGLDLEMPSGLFLNPQHLEIMVRAGKVKESTIDTKVRNILRTIIRAGFLNTDYKLDYPMNDPVCGKTALEVAREGVVLLKNENDTLPLDTDRIKNILVVGPFGDNVPEGSGSSRVEPFSETSTVDGLKAILGPNVNVTYHRAVLSSLADELMRNSVYSHINAEGDIESGLYAEYFNNQNLQGDPVRKKTEYHINVNSSTLAGNNVNQKFVSIRWTGKITPEKTANYTLAACSDDGIRVWLDDKLIVDEWSDHAALSREYKCELIAGCSYNVKIEYYQKDGDAVALFGWGKTKTGLVDTAVLDEAANADAVIACIGLGAKYEGEDLDHGFDLPDKQDDLVKEMASVNDNTIVVVHSGSNVNMQEWVNKVPAVLQGWYPGQAGGQAIAEILLGKVNPSGKLPQTYEKRWEDNPVYGNYFSKDGHNIDYVEGTFVGYRGFEKNNIKPQFAFGHGLSYTTFEYGKPHVAVSSANSKPTATVTFDLKNTGQMAGSEVAQVYLSWKDAKLPQAVKALKGFEKVKLQPGKSKKVKVVLDSDSLSSFDVDSGKWIIDGDKFEILVGSASDDIRGKADFRF